MESMTISLFDPGMTALHKAGLAGLWMTLKAFEDSGLSALAQGEWERAPTSVVLRWEGTSRKFFAELFEKSFKIDPNGLFWFPALGLPGNNPQHAKVLQEAILGSFLQHGRTRKADNAADPRGAMSVEFDGVPTVLAYHRIHSYAHQKDDFLPGKANSLAGWHVPGGVVRHTGLGQKSTALEEPPQRALVLRFAIIGGIYFEMRSRGGGVRPRYALVIPEINSLQEYAAARSCFLRYGVQQLYASGTADAGYRVLAELHAADLVDDIAAASCRVISFGTVPWSPQQKTRVSLMSVRAESQASLRTFNLCRQYLSPILIRLEEKEPFWDIPQVPDLVARNLTQGRQWWEGFSEFVADAVRRKHVFAYEKGGLAQMVEDTAVTPESPERSYVTACHEAWRRRMGELGERARREAGANERRQKELFARFASREFEKLRVAFSRCKNAATLRQVVTDFWARAGSLNSLKEAWPDMLGLLDAQNWRKGKDLALLALASYKPATEEEARVMEAPGTIQLEREDAQ